MCCMTCVHAYVPLCAHNFTYGMCFYCWFSLNIFGSRPAHSLRLQRVLGWTGPDQAVCACLANVFFILTCSHLAQVWQMSARPPAHLSWAGLRWQQCPADAGTPSFYADWGNQTMKTQIGHRVRPHRLLMMQEFRDQLHMTHSFDDTRGFSVFNRL